MGAGATHQATQKGSSMGLLMPMYTFGIVAFFVYTIMKVRNAQLRHYSKENRSSIWIMIFFLSNLKQKLVMRKSEDMSPYPTPQNKDDNFKQEVFRRDNKIPNLGMVFWTKKFRNFYANWIFLKNFLCLGWFRMETTRYK